MVFLFDWFWVVIFFWGLDMSRHVSTSSEHLVGGGQDHHPAGDGRQQRGGGEQHQALQGVGKAAD